MPAFRFLPRIHARGAWRSLLLACFILPLIGCAQFGSISESMFMMSPQDEQALGVKIKEEARKQYKFDAQPDVVAYVRDLGQKLWVVSPKGDITPEFFVVDDDTINAFAMPGGGVYVQTGAIRAAADEAELAGVIAHELGHVTRRHGARAVSRQTGVQTIQEMILGKDTGDATKTIGNLVTQTTLLHYTREDETQADTIAVATLDRAGYDPEALRTFFATLTKTYGDQSGKVASFLASHPPTNERMANVDALIKQLKSPPTSRPKTRLQQIQALLPPPAPAPSGK